jgi:hypothetical protein
MNAMEENRRFVEAIRRSRKGVPVRKCDPGQSARRTTDDGVSHFPLPPHLVGRVFFGFGQSFARTPLAVQAAAFRTGQLGAEAISQGLNRRHSQHSVLSFLVETSSCCRCCAWRWRSLPALGYGVSACSAWCSWFGCTCCLPSCLFSIVQYAFLPFRGYFCLALIVP